MPELYAVLLAIHVAVGFASLGLFWLPLAFRKGSAWHVRAGRWYANAMYLVAGTAFLVAAMVLITPMATKHPDNAYDMAEAFRVSTRERMFSLFLMSIAVLVLSSVRHGLLALRAKHDHRLMRSPPHVALNAALGLLGLSLIWAGAVAGQVLFYIFAGFCITAAVGNLRYVYRRSVAAHERVIAHLGAMLGAGIGSYTAFFVFGGNRFLAEILSGPWRLLPWVLPAIVGSLAINRLSRRYRPQLLAAGRAT